MISNKQKLTYSVYVNYTFIFIIYNNFLNNILN